MNCKINLITFLLLSISLIRASAQSETILPYAEDFQFITKDGAWCWFSDPRAIYVNDQIIGGFVNKEGSICVFKYNPANYDYQQTVLYEKLDYDDHANPSFMKLADNRIVIWFSAHGGTTDSPIYYAVSKHAADISEWGDLQQIKPAIPGRFGYCYTNTAMLSEENNKIYLFFRGPNFKPDFVTTTDLKTWSEPSVLVQDDTTKAYVRPYMKMANNGKDKIFLAFTDDHPRNRADNSIYFLLYKGGKYYKADGTVISESIENPVITSICDKVYDATITYDKSWIWDIAYDKNENPVIVYARFSKMTGEHSYWYATWNGEEWNNKLITKAGLWFQRNEYTKNFFEYERDYSGGVYLDHENPSVVYTSRPIEDVFEIEKWTTDDFGTTWKTEAITQNSEKDNVRPFVIRGHKAGQPEVIWMYNFDYPGFRAYNSAIRINQKAKGESGELTKEAVLSVTNKVADWQIEHFKEGKYGEQTKSWIAGAFYKGLFDFAGLTSNESYFAWMKKIFDRQQWQVDDYMYHADMFCTPQTYVDMYQKYKEERMIIPTMARIDWIIAHPSKGGLDIDYSKRETYERWSWCDALFMAPPLYVQLWNMTGQKKYMDFADKEFKATYNHLYDKQEKLFYRDSRYFGKQEANGKKVFWGRGNGWVIGGLVAMLKTLPKTDKKYRPFYENLFKEMCIRLADLQSEDGFWHASLLDPASYPSPETSATGFIMYGLAYAVNEGFVPAETYMPVIKKGWEALVSSVDTNGKLGWVQPVGADPRKVTKDMTEQYGPGAFLLTACEIYKLSE